MLSKNRKYVELFRKIMDGQTEGFRGGNIQFDRNTSTEERLALAKEQFRRQMLMDAGIDPHERISGFELQNIQQLMNDESIQSRTRQVFLRVAVNGEKPDDVAAAFGIERNAIDQIKSRMMPRLQKIVSALEKAGNV